MSIRAIIFDLGGTLLDWPTWESDEPQHWRLSYNYLIEHAPERRRPELEIYIQAMREATTAHWQGVNEIQSSSTPTMIVQDAFNRMKIQVSEEELLAALDGYARAVSGWATIFDDTVATLLELRKQGYRLGLLSNTWWAADWHNADLATHGIDSLLDEVVYTSDLPHYKPHPSVFL